MAWIRSLLRSFINSSAPTWSSWLISGRLFVWSLIPTIRAPVVSVILFRQTADVLINAERFRSGFGIWRNLILSHYIPSRCSHAFREKSSLFAFITIAKNDRWSKFTDIISKSMSLGQVSHPRCFLIDVSYWDVSSTIGRVCGPRTWSSDWVNFNSNVKWHIVLV